MIIELYLGGANKTTCLTTQVYKMFGKFADKPTVLQLFEI